jgi:geranylgeranyl diphosphate synthase type II
MQGRGLDDGGAKMNFNEEMANLASQVEAYLEGYFERLLETSEKSLIQSMRYSVMAGGKRIRPVLVLAVAKVLDVGTKEILPFAAAIEMIHTYSLIHDDLPAMDDDEYRRGKLTNHMVYGQALAILAGDALLNEALELLMKNALDARDKMKNALAAAYIVANAAGKDGMIAGQVIDMESEGKTIEAETLKRMHRKKTGALLKASVLAPAVYASAPDQILNALTEYADSIGIAFQIKDDILDVESSTEALGKSVGSDARNHKTTYVSLFGLEKAKMLLHEVTQNAVSTLLPFGEKAWFLKETAQYIASRIN